MVGDGDNALSNAYRLVKLKTGKCAVHSTADAETMHPGCGPAAEAKALYVEQLGIPERVGQQSAEFVIWDVGLGAAANVLAAIRACEHLSARLHILSFDRTTEPLRFALQHLQQLDYIGDYAEALRHLLKEGKSRVPIRGLNVCWELVIGDFPTMLPNLSALPRPHAIFFDPFSPLKNPEMWTQPLFADLYRLLEPEHPCALATYSRSTMVRAAMLLAGFFVGYGRPTGLKEETTIAANTLDLIDEPLDERWLERAKRSQNAAPLSHEVYSRARLSPKALEALRAHSQFRRGQP